MTEPSILFESEDLVLVDKPSGMATEPDRSRAPSLLDWVAARSPNTPHAVSRLDVGVSGVVTFAISARAKVAAVKAREAGSIERRYIALVAGTEQIAEASISSPVDGKPASTSYRPLASVAGGRSTVTLVLFTPKTGRMHQLRVHAQALGAPILGDRKYGGASSIANARGRVTSVERVLLHAFAVRLDLGLPSDPPGFVTSPIPASFLDLWRVLDGAPEAWKDVSRCVDGSEPGS